MKKYKLIHFTDWCDYQAVLDAHSNLGSEWDVTFIHDCATELTPVLKHLYRFQKSRKVNILLPIKNISLLNKWLEKELIPHVDDPSSTCLIFSSLYAGTLHRSFWTHLKDRGFKLVLVYVDRMKLTPSLMDVEDLKTIFDLVCTYNVEEAKEANIDVHPIRMSDLTYLRCNPIESDIFFIGSEKGRIDQIHALYDTCDELGLKCDFYVAGYNGNDYRKGINYISKIPYTETLEKASKTKAIVNLFQQNASGVTLRDMEAYNFGTYIVTNNNDKSICDLYQENQYISLNDSNFRQKLLKLKDPFVRFERKNNCCYNYDNFYSWINKKMNKNN